jgi:hypothetical protein
MTWSEKWPWLSWKVSRSETYHQRRTPPARGLYKSDPPSYLAPCIKSALRLIGAPPTVPSGTVAAIPAMRPFGAKED